MVCRNQESAPTFSSKDVRDVKPLADPKQHYSVLKVKRITATKKNRSPEMFAPARIPVAAGKKMAKTEKKVSPFRKSGGKFSANMDAARYEKDKRQN